MSRVGPDAALELDLSPRPPTLGPPEKNPPWRFLLRAMKELAQRHRWVQQDTCGFETSSTFFVLIRTTADRL